MSQTGLQVFVSTQQSVHTGAIKVIQQAYDKRLLFLLCRHHILEIISSLLDHKLQYSVDSNKSGNSLTIPNSEQLMLQPLESNPNLQVMNPGGLMRRGMTL